MMLERHFGNDVRVRCALVSTVKQNTTQRISTLVPHTALHCVYSSNTYTHTAYRNCLNSVCLSLTRVDYSFPFSSTIQHGVCEWGERKLGVRIYSCIVAEGLLGCSSYEKADSWLVLTVFRTIFFHSFKSDFIHVCSRA